MAKEDAAAVNDQVVADTTTTDSAPVENTESAVVEDEFDGVGDTPLDPGEQVETPEETEGEHADETNTEAQPQGEQPVNPKDEWNSLKGSSQERFHQAVNRAKEAERRLAEIEAQKSQFATEQDLLDKVNPDTGDYYTPQEAERIAFQQSRQIRNQQLEQESYGLQIQRAQVAITGEADQVAENFPELVDPNNENYDPEIAAEYDAVLGQNLIYEIADGQGNSYRYPAATLVANGINPATQATLVGSNVSPLQIAKLTAESARKAAAKAATLGQAKAQKATEKMLANADTAPGVASKGTGNDLDDLFEKVKDVKFA